jgi:RNA polymerase sigma-70 factor, ECF subfamily
VVVDLEQTFRDEWGRVLATLIGFLGDFDLAEEATQEAFATAAERWPRDGEPTNRRAWLVTTAATGPSIAFAATRHWSPRPGSSRYSRR